MSKKIILSIFIIMILAVNLVFGFPRLSRYSAVDEPYWTYGRISKFWTAVAANKWSSTNVNDKPGITVALLSGFGLTKINPMDYKLLRGEIKTPEQLNTIDNINFLFRLPIFIFNLLMLPVFYWLLKKLLGQTVAIFSFIFIGLSPIILGISLIINPDALLWTFLPLSLLSYLVFQKENNRKYIYLSGIFLGLALLTKYVSNILYIFFFALPFLNYIFQEEKPRLLTYLKKSVVNYALLIFTSMATFFILFPATWKKPSLLLKGTFLSKAFETTWPLFASIIILIIIDIYLLKGKTTHWLLNKISVYKKLILRLGSFAFLLAIAVVFVNTYTGMKFYDFESIIASPKGSSGAYDPYVFSGKVFSDIYGLIFGISPIAFLFVIYALTMSFCKKTKPSAETVTIFYLILFIGLYYIGSTVNNVVATVRYQIALYPLTFIIAAIGITRFLANEKIKIFKLELIAPAAMLIFLTFSLFQIKPFYFAYASALLPEKYTLNLKDMGDGSYEAAAYLNNLPNAKDLTIWSDKGAVCAEFLGTCNIGFNEKDFRNHPPVDYFITSSGRKSRTLKLSYHLKDIINFAEAYSTENFEQKIIIGNRPENYVKIIPGISVYKK